MFRLRIALVALVLLTLVGAAGHRSTPPADVVVLDVSQALPAAFKASDEREAQARLDQLAVLGQGMIDAQHQADEEARLAAAQAAEQQQQRLAAAATRVAPRQSATTPAAPAPSGDLADVVRQFFPENFDSAWGVSGCESEHDPGAISSGGGNWGLFQINTSHRADFEAVTGQSWESGALNAYYNTMYARKLYDGSGWDPWSCSWAA